MTQKSLTEELSHVLADSYALYLKNQNFHWNVEGPHFKALHDLFEEHYTELASAIDEIAERIRAIGCKAPGTWRAFAALTSIEEGDEGADANTMLKTLADDQDLIIATLSKALGSAQAKGDEVTIGLITERMAVHEKARWMLRASTP